MEASDQTFGRRLRAQRKALRLTQEEAAAEFEVSRAAWQYWEADAHAPHPDHGAKLAEFFAREPPPKRERAQRRGAPERTAPVKQGDRSGRTTPDRWHISTAEKAAIMAEVAAAYGSPVEDADFEPRHDGMLIRITLADGTLWEDWRSADKPRNRIRPGTGTPRPTGGAAGPGVAAEGGSKSTAELLTSDVTNEKRPDMTQLAITRGTRDTRPLEGGSRRVTLVLDADAEKKLRWLGKRHGTSMSEAARKAIDVAVGDHDVDGAGDAASDDTK